MSEEFSEIIEKGHHYYRKHKNSKIKKNYLQAMNHPSFKNIPLSDQCNVWIRLAAACKKMNESTTDVDVMVENLSVAEDCYKSYLKVNTKHVQVRLSLLDTLIERGGYYIERNNPGDLEQASKDMDFAKELLALLLPHVNKQQHLDFKDFERHLLCAFADQAYDTGAYEKAITRYEEAIQILEEMIPLFLEETPSNSKLLADTYFNLAECYAFTDHSPKALFSFTVALELYTKIASEERHIVEKILQNFSQYVHDKKIESISQRSPSQTKPYNSDEELLLTSDEESTDKESDKETIKSTPVRSPSQFFLPLPNADKPIQKSQDELNAMKTEELEVFLTNLEKMYQSKLDHLSSLKREKELRQDCK